MANKKSSGHYLRWLIGTGFALGVGYLISNHETRMTGLSLAVVGTFLALNYEFNDQDEKWGEASATSDDPNINTIMLLKFIRRGIYNATYLLLIIAAILGYQAIR